MLRLAFRCLILLVIIVYNTHSNGSLKPIYIAVDADLSGGAKSGGEAIVKGAELAIDDINDKGGLLGRPLELIVSNHRGNPSRGIAHINTLAKQDDLLAILGGVHTPVALAQLTPIHKHNIIFMSPWAAGTGITDNAYAPNNVFRVSLRDAHAADTMISHANSRNIRKVTLVLERTGWGRSNFEAIKESVEALDISIDQVVWFNWRQKDFHALLDNVSNDSNKAFVFVGNVPEGVAFAQAVLDSSDLLTMPIISHWGIASGNFVDQVGLENLQKLDLTVLQSFHFSQITNTELAQRVLSKYQGKYDPDAEFISIPSAVGLAHAFDIVNMLVATAQQVNSIEADKIRSGLEALKDFKGLVKEYDDPFDSKRRDALLSADYLMTKFNIAGYLVPFND